MEILGKHAPVRIKSLHDLKLAKQACRYDLKIREDALKSGVNIFQQTVTDSLRLSLMRIGQKAVYLAALKLVRLRWRKRKG